MKHCILAKVESDKTYIDIPFPNKSRLEGNLAVGMQKAKYERCHFDVIVISKIV